MVAEELQIIIDAKVSQAVKDLKKVQKGIGDTGKSSSKLSTIFKQLAGPIALGAVIAGFIKVGIESSKAASDAEEIGSKYATIFRDMGSEAEAMADGFADSFGLAGSTSRELLGNTADLLTGLGFTQAGAADLSMQVNTLAADLASFSNFSGGTTGASEALTKALLGEAESAKALGIVINQNTKEYKDSVKFYTEVEGKTLLQAKAFTALKFATEQSGNAIGDVARTWESHANVTKRLRESTKSFKEELGKMVNNSATPMLRVTDKLVSSMAEWLGKTNDLNDAIKKFEEGTADGEESVVALNNELENQVISLAALEAAEGRHIAGAKEAIEFRKEQIEQTRMLIGVAARAAALEAQGAKFSEAAAKQKAIDNEADATAAKKANEELKALQSAFADTYEGQVKSLETQIAFFETFKEGPMSIAVLKDLNAEYEELTEKQEEQKILIEDLDEGWTNFNQTVIGDLEGQTSAVEELNQTYVDLAETGLGAFASAFEEVGAGNISLWEGIKQGSKDAMSAILKGLAQESLARAAISLVPGPTFNPFAAAGYTAAAAGAYAASGLVQSFATGGNFTANEPTLIEVGDNASGQEKVTVEPLGGSSGGHSSDRFRLVSGSGDMLGWIQREGINGGKLHSSQGGRL